jgi:hypothetical protein
VLIYQHHEILNLSYIYRKTLINKKFWEEIIPYSLFTPILVFETAVGKKT